MKHIFYALILLLFGFLVSCDQHNHTEPSGPDNEDSYDGPTLFQLLSKEECGIEFTNTISDTGDFTPYNSVYVYNGGGVAAADVNNDGLTDLIFVGNQVRSRLYLNEGDFKFKDITESAGIDDRPGWSTGVNFADVNGDGNTDIYISKGGFKGAENRNNQLYINNGDLTFTEKAEEYGINDAATATHANFFDYDNDGDLDLYTVNHPEDFDLIMDFYYYKSDASELDTFNSNRLYENTGEKFVDVTEASGLGLEKGFSLSSCASDINNDGLVDLYVANDFLTPDYVFINNGDKTFRQRRNDMVDKTPMFAMGSDISDINNDGRHDFMVVDMEPEGHFRRKNNDITFPIEFYGMQQDFFNAKQYSRNVLQVQNPDGSFSEIAEFADVARTDWSWAVLFADFDNDGYKDLYITNGTKKELNDRDYMSLNFNDEMMSNAIHRHDADDLIKNLPVSHLQNYIYKNNGDLTFDKKMNEWGVADEVNSSGAVYADLNNDGLLDLIVNNIDERSYIYKNTGSLSEDNNYLRVELEGAENNKSGYGARVYVTTENGRQLQEQTNARGFQSTVEPVMHFGLGKETQVKKLQVVWPGGKSQTLENVEANQLIKLAQADATEDYDYAEADGGEQLMTETPFSGPQYIHEESNFNDFKVQKLIPYKQSKEGPKITIGDINNDGREDFYIGGAKGYPGQLYTQSANGQFVAAQQELWEQNAMNEDQGVLLFDANGDDYYDLYVASGSSEFSTGNEALQDRFYLNDGSGKLVEATENIPSIDGSTGPVTAADYDGDGDMDLFVGGRLVSGTYGMSPKSYLLENDGSGKFTDVTESKAGELREAGPLTAAHWADMDGDSDNDLVLAGEWMPITIFINNSGELSKQDSEGLNDNNGLWMSVALADFDNDGDADIVAGNYGLNSVLKASSDKPLTLYIGDYDEDDYNESVLFHWIGDDFATYADRNLFCKEFSYYNNVFHTFKSFAEASIEDIFSKEQIEASQIKYVQSTSSMYFENKGDGTFAGSNLPSEAQVSQVNAVLPGDFNADGNLDVLIGGNTYGHIYDQGAMSALRGLVLIGDGTGKFDKTSADESGVNIEGEIRSFAKIKTTNGTAVLVGINNGTLKMYALNRTEM